MSDQIQRFVFENCEMRGAILHLDQTLQRNLNAHDYSEPVKKLVAEAITVVALLATTVKMQGRISLQLKAEGPVSLLLAESTQDFGLRALAQCREDQQYQDFAQLAEDGILALSLLPDDGQNYQGIVPLTGANLSECLRLYFQQSEHLDTSFFLFVDGERSAALFVQALPSAQGDDVARIRALAATLRADEIFNLPVTEVLHRLFHEETLRLFDAQEVRFQCRCSRAKTYASLRLLETDERQQLLREQGHIKVACEFCRTEYEFSAQDVALLDGDDAVVH